MLVIDEVLIIFEKDEYSPEIEMKMATASLLSMYVREMQPLLSE